MDEHDAGADAGARDDLALSALGTGWRGPDGSDVAVSASSRLQARLQARGLRVRRQAKSTPLPRGCEILGVRPGHPLEAPGDPEWPTAGWVSMLVATRTPETPETSETGPACETGPARGKTENRRLRACRRADLPRRDQYVVLGWDRETDLCVIETRPRVHQTRDMQHAPLRAGTQVLQLRSVARVNVPRPLRVVDGVAYLCWRGWTPTGLSSSPEPTHYVVVLVDTRSKSHAKRARTIAEAQALVERGVVLKIDAPGEQRYELWVDARLLAERPQFDE